jgi:hypothetical protein
MRFDVSFNLLHPKLSGLNWQTSTLTRGLIDGWLPMDDCGGGEVPAGSTFIHTGAAIRHGGVRSGRILVGAPCSSVVLWWRWRWRAHGGCVEEVPAWGRRWWQRRWRQGPGGGSMRSSGFLDGGLAASTCEGNKIGKWFRQKGGYWIYTLKYLQWFYIELLLKLVYQ